MKSETFIIVNPTAGDGQAEKRWQDFENDLKKNHIHYHAVITEYQNHATELISKAISSGYNRIGVFSGDGTLNEVLQGLFKEDYIKSEDLKIIFFSMFEDSVILHRAMQTGAMGYISKSSSPEILISAIKVVAKGQKYIERGLAVNLANQLLDTNVDIAAKLTKREFEIFIAIAMNKSRFDVADELGLSAKTVSNALTVIKRKLDAVPSQFSVIAAKHGYIGDAELSASQSVSFDEKSEK